MTSWGSGKGRNDLLSYVDRPQDRLIRSMRMDMPSIASLC
jgi:hypothetical protein